jgi:hypothetical protein
MAFGSISVDKITDSEGSVFSPSSALFRNRIINGDMRIDQRNAGASVSVSGGAYTLDRWNYDPSASLSWYTFQQNGGSVTPPAGFSNYLGITSTGANTPTSGQFSVVSQYIEGFNTADLAFGTANAVTVTLSFWIRSSLTGTFGGALQNSAVNRSYPFTYTISAANTWEKKSITIAGDTSGTWVGATNGVGLRLVFNLGTGSTYQGTAGAWAGADYRSVTGATNISATNGATWYITGVQLEVGSVATPFERRPYGTELALCQRYYYLHASGVDKPIGNACYYTSTSIYGIVHFPITMRSAPTLSQITGTDYYRIYRNGDADTFNGFLLQSTSTTAYAFYQNTNISGTAGHGGWVETNNASGFLAFAAEL